MTQETHSDDDPELARFVAEVRERSAHEGASDPPRRDFGEVVRRAQRLDPRAISEDQLREADALAAVVPLSAGREAPASDPELDAFVADVRGLNEAVADERRLAGIPPLPLTPPRRRLGPHLAGLTAVAAVLAVALLGATPHLFGQPQAPEAGRQAMMRGILEESRRALKAAVDRERSAALRGAASATPPADAADLAPADDAAAADADASPDENPDDDDALSPADTAGDAEGSAPREAAPAIDPEERARQLEALDRDAQERWRRGDLDGAERLFRALIRRDPRGRWAHLAYGDLFAIARQRGDAGDELGLWREYLRRYPRGPHADDAQAGICRRSDQTARAECWQRYLDDRPRGAYRQQAEAANRDLTEAKP